MFPMSAPTRPGSRGCQQESRSGCVIVKPKHRHGQELVRKASLLEDEAGPLPADTPLYSRSRCARDMLHTCSDAASHRSYSPASNESRVAIAPRYQLHNDVQFMYVINAMIIGT